ncbi:hypothetical protein KW790_00925 [Candidatus Parcubacteria bacterium]|nr:hypothetical protein [Candidatus Parcubacteria bacterium]
MQKYLNYLRDYKFLAGVAALVVILGGAFYMTRVRPTSKSNSANVLNSLDWTTYSNDMLGFSIQVPKDATVSKNWNVLTITPANNPSKSWNIQEVDNVYTGGIDAFIKTQFGKDCSFDSLKPGAQEGTFDVEIASSPACEVGSGTVLKYSPTTHRLAEWDLGEGTTFGDSDSQMSDSFKFL